jgi:hypothetical protein
MCQEMNNVYCANFATSQRHWMPCNSVWHGQCCTPRPNDNFFDYVATNEDGFDWQPPTAMQSQPGPGPGHTLLCTIHWANLDSLWGREPYTVEATLSEMQSVICQWKKVWLAPQLLS